MPLTEKQLAFLSNCNHRWNIKTGATGSGKSFVDYSVAIPKRIEAARGEGLLVLLGNTRGTLERNILEPMRALWPGLVGNIRSDNTVDIFGKKVYALGADNKKHVSRIQGATFEYVYGDEITTWSEEVFQMLKSRLRCEHSHFDGTCNPENPNHWFKRFLDSDADIYQQSYVIDDGVLPAHVVEQLKKEYAGTMYYDRWILGLWAAAEGLIYPMFSEARHVLSKEPDTEGEYYVSSDYGIQNPNVFLLWRKECGTKRWICLREDYYSGREERHQLTDAELADRMTAMLNGIMPKFVILDPSASSMKAALQRRGYHVWDANNDVLDGISDVATMLHDGQIGFMESCKNTIAEFGSYFWDEKAADAGVDAPLKQNDHCLTGDTLADTVCGQVRIDELVGKMGCVYCTNGKRKEIGVFHDVRMTQKEAEVFEVTLADGRSVKATADHPILTRRGWVRIKDLRGDDEIACIGGKENEID